MLIGIFILFHHVRWLTLMKGNEVVETENDRRNALLLAFRRVRDLNFGDVVAMDMHD